MYHTRVIIAKNPAEAGKLAADIFETEIQKIPLLDPVGHGNYVCLAHDSIGGVLPQLHEGVYL